MPRFIPVFAVCLLPTVAIADRAAPAPGNPAPLYLPTTIGTKWVYEWSVDGRKQKGTFETVTAVQEVRKGVKAVTISSVFDGKTYQFQKWEASADGLAFVENLIGGQPVFSPVQFLKLPHRDGQTWKTGRASQVMTARGRFRVKVPAGEYDTIRVDVQSEQAQCPVEFRWYAPGVGLVKLQSQVSLVIALTSFTPGNE